MQTDKTLRTNTSKVCDILEWNIQQICIANGFLTDGVLCDRRHDPRLLIQDKAQEYREKGTSVTIKVGDWELLSSATKNGARGTLGMVKRKQIHIDLVVNQTLSKPQDDAGITIDQLQSWITHDIEFGIIYKPSPGFISPAVAALNAIDPTWGAAPSCINPLLVKGAAGPLLKFPNCVQVLRLVYSFDESSPPGTAGGGF